MAKYCRSKRGEVYDHDDYPYLKGDTPVIVIPEADWQKLVASVRACGGRGAAPVDRIWEIIFRTEEANDA